MPTILIKRRLLKHAVKSHMMKQDGKPIFDPTNFNLAQTFSTPFSTQPSIEMQLEKLQKC